MAEPLQSAYSVRRSLTWRVIAVVAATLAAFAIAVHVFVLDPHVRRQSAAD